MKRCRRDVSSRNSGERSMRVQSTWSLRPSCCGAVGHLPSQGTGCLFAFPRPTARKRERTARQRGWRAAQPPAATSAASPPRGRDELHADRRTARAGPGRDGERGNAEQRPRAAEERVAGGAVVERRRLAGDRGTRSVSPGSRCSASSARHSAPSATARSASSRGDTRGRARGTRAGRRSSSSAWCSSSCARLRAMSKAMSCSCASASGAKRSGSSSSRTRRAGLGEPPRPRPRPRARPSSSARSHHGVRANATAGGASGSSGRLGPAVGEHDAEQVEVLGVAREPAERVERARSAP